MIVHGAVEAGSPVLVSISLKDSIGEATNDYEVVEFRSKELIDFTVAATNEDETTLTRTFALHSTHAGSYALEVVCNGEQVNGSPTTVTILQGMY